MWGDFNSSLGLTSNKKTTTSKNTVTGTQTTDIYSAAAQYALEQLRRRNGEVY